MRLKKIGKTFPEDYDIIPYDKHYLRGPNTKKTYKWHVVDEGTPMQRVIPQLIHHPVYRLLEDLKQYDLSERTERVEFLSVLAVAYIIDDYKLIDKKIYVIKDVFKELGAMEDLNSFITDLEKAEKNLKYIIETLGVDELNEEAVKGSPVSMELE